MKTIGTKHKIVVVDDHAVFREGLVRIINQEKDMEVCGEAENAADGLKLAQSEKPEMMILDISMEGMNGIDLAKNLRARFPDLRILVLSMHKEALYAERALRAGANGYIMKRESGRKLVSAIRIILSGQTYISDELNQIILQKLANSGRNESVHSIETLSDRELEVFQLIGSGYGTRQIAEKISISMKTVESHREHIREKLGLKNTFELVQQAIHWIHSEELSGGHSPMPSKK